jgi:hypothetical protein
MHDGLSEIQNESKEHELMRLSFAIGVRFLHTLVVVSLMLPAGFARERGPRVEVVCLSPPVPVKLAEKQVLVYELHVTNFEAVPLTLKRLEVFADTENGQPLSIIARFPVRWRHLARRERTFERFGTPRQYRRY